MVLHFLRQTQIRTILLHLLRKAYKTCQLILYTFQYGHEVHIIHLGLLEVTNDCSGTLNGRRNLAYLK